MNALTERSIFLFPDPDPAPDQVAWWQIRVPVSDEFVQDLGRGEADAWRTLLDSCQRIIERSDI